MDKRRRSAGRGEPRELKLQRVDLCQVAAGVVVAASLAASEPEPAARVCVAGPAPAQVDDRREVLPLLQRGGGDAVAPEGARDRAIQQRCGHFHRVSGHHARVERVEPARPRVVPRAVLDHDVVMDAVASGFGEGAVGDLKHADGARGRPVHLEWVPAESPPPIGPCHRVAAALHLGQCGQQFRRDDRCGVLGEERAVLPPGLRRSFKSEPLTGKNTSVGLRATCTIQFTAAQTVTSRTVPTTIRMANGATRKARSARPARRQAAAERRARRRRVRVLRGAPREIVAWGMMGTPPVCPARGFRSLRRRHQPALKPFFNAVTPGRRDKPYESFAISRRLGGSALIHANEKRSLAGSNVSRLNVLRNQIVNPDVPIAGLDNFQRQAGPGCQYIVAFDSISRVSDHA